MTERDSLDLLYARLSDLASMTQKGAVGLSLFLTPRQKHFAEIYLKKTHPAVPFLFYGGYAGAERERIYLLPDYLADFGAEALFSDGAIDSDIDSVLVTGSGYRALSHRDCLGAVLGLGIERDSVGDIVITDERGFSAYVFTTEKMADFLVSELNFVANDKVKTIKKEMPQGLVPEKKTQAIRDTIPSARLDCIVAAVCNISREKAKNAVESGIVECDFECQTRPDKPVPVPCLISVRGFGRFRINSASEQTKKGRIRLEAEKFI